MSITVFRAFSIIDGTLIEEDLSSRQGSFRAGHVAAVLTNIPDRAPCDGPALVMEISVGRGTNARIVKLQLAKFLSGEEYSQSLVRPFCFERIGLTLAPNKSFSNPDDAHLRWMWLYRDAIYVTGRSPRASEMEEVILRIKSLHFQRDEAFKRLKEQVSNFEAIEANIKTGTVRQAIPEDVKLLVWSRDGGVCVKCGAAKDLHFDHIIPHSRGGSNEAANIQLLCRTCNLAKGDRLI